MQDATTFQPADPTGRLRLLESRYGLIRDRMLLVNQNFLSGHRSLLSEIKVIDTEIKELKKDLFEIKEILSHVIRELKDCARKENLKILEKYINIWNPLNFVTEKEVTALIKSHKK
ncbi:MAG: hypothetical protein KKG60_03065 [Nanoarchaeota archaeon]|nr:hypothetical protein [Nanoarchaeota archaeon]